MKNRIVESIGSLGLQAEKVALGADQYGASLPLVINTAAAIRGDNTQVTDASSGYEAADRELTTRRATMREAAEAGRNWLILAKDTFKPRLGPDYNEAWDRTGLLNNLSVPTSHDGVQVLLNSFKGFLTSNADFEVANLNITAAQAGTLWTAMNTARSAVQTQQTHVRNQKADRDARVKALRSRLRNTINELAGRIGRLDPKWLAFGLNMPGAPTTPQAPLNITAVLIGPNAVSVQWEPSVYASHYRVWAKVVGVDQELINVGDSTSTEFTMQGMTAGAQVQIAVSAAVTGGGESLKSEVVTVAIPN